MQDSDEKQADRTREIDHRTEFSVTGEILRMPGVTVYYVNSPLMPCLRRLVRRAYMLATAVSHLDVTGVSLGTLS